MDTIDTFYIIINDIRKESSTIKKSGIISDVFKQTSNIELWLRFLLPKISNKKYNLQTKKLVKIFSVVLNIDIELLNKEIRNNGLAKTISHVYEKQNDRQSYLTMTEMNNMLNELCQIHTFADYITFFNKEILKMSPNDLEVMILLIQENLEIGAGVKVILDGLHPDAYTIYSRCSDIDYVLKSTKGDVSIDNFDSAVKNNNIFLMMPIQPMLANTINYKKLEMISLKDYFIETKYDGERIQIHKKNNCLQFFSRSLKKVDVYKVEFLFDSELVLIDKDTNVILPFGSLGKHKRKIYNNAISLLIIFDCLYFDNKDISHYPLYERRKILENNIIENKNIRLSQKWKLNTLDNLMSKIIEENLEGLVLKNKNEKYYPNKRKWIKIKKDSFKDGNIADTFDLVVLGGWYGTGKNKNIVSTFLMGCYDEEMDKWNTVTNVHNGISQTELYHLQNSLITKMNDMKIIKEIPSWLNISNSCKPDFIIKEPKTSQVWEIIATECTTSNKHTMNISLRFPRFKTFRTDLTWKEATSFKYLLQLHK
jgi:DNA ligase-3